ncbi:putative rrp44-like exonuclease [Bodo saltans virus]|uniref:DIS3-like exonuclease 1 n=1 Tax=Bodo saltans virus TaxID=2024608 RepID=A0A2H4UVB7_9VIRU|nr:putative rrp44-like exonuclease [Bodo saltans virus]ATZ80868.1 putative rrp44-like exonuclease [Bodo saltans virus]
MQFDIPIFFGIIHFSSTYTYTDDKDFIRKDTSSFLKTKLKILTRTKKINQKNDMYAILKIEHELCTPTVVVCSVLEYISEIDKTPITSNILKVMSTCHWTNTKKMNTSFEKISSIDLTTNREILTNIAVYTIDPQGCLDIDDALHHKSLYDSNGKLVGHEIGIHIADVSSYIEENSIYDLELQKRVETLYMDDGIVHMIPETLSIEYLSLFANKQRRTFSVILTLNDEYKITNVSFKKMLITVNENLTYEDAENKKHTTLSEIYNIGEILKNNIKDSFKDNEIYDMHQMVAVYMIYANKLVADKIVSYDATNVLLRQHGDCNIHDENEYFDSVKNNSENEYFDSVKAKYQLSTLNSYHSGLHLQYYTHFTSPIRRYADIIVHRQLWKVLCNTKLINNDMDNIVTYINFCEKYYSLLKRNFNIMRIVDTLQIEITHANIINIDIEKCSIRLLIPKYNIQYEYYISNDKLKSSITIDINNDNVKIINNHTHQETIFALYQTIQIKLVPAKQHMLKLLIEII